MDRAKAKQQILNEKVFGPMVDKTFSDGKISKNEFRTLVHDLAMFTIEQM